MFLSGILPIWVSLGISHPTHLYIGEKMVLFLGGSPNDDYDNDGSDNCILLLLVLKIIYIMTLMSRYI